MVVDVIMPKMGESLTEGTILEWYKTGSQQWVLGSHSGQSPGPHHHQWLNRPYPVS